MTRTIREGLKHKEGQALVLAALMMFVLSIAVITTVNIGHNVSERIRLQNTSDAAAYSTAALEARAFNFYAFANRAQVSHYVSAMMWHSLNSMIYWFQAWITDLYAMVRTLNQCHKPSGSAARKAIIKIVCNLIKLIPYVGQVIAFIIKMISQALKVAEKIIEAMNKGIKAINPDKLIGTLVIPFYQIMNKALAGVSQAVMYSLMGTIVTGSNSIIQENDPNIKSALPMQAIAGSLAVCMFDRAHYAEANGGPFSPRNPMKSLAWAEKADKSKIARAKSVMAGISNATRYGCDVNSSGGMCPEKYLTDRKLSAMLNLDSGFLGILGKLLDWVAFKKGQARLLSYAGTRGSYGKGSPPNKIRSTQSSPNGKYGMHAMGDNLGVDDIYRFGFLPASSMNPFNCKSSEKFDKCWGSPDKNPDNAFKTSVWALNKDDPDQLFGHKRGIHWRVVFKGADKWGVIDHCWGKKVPFFGCIGFDKFVANVRPDPDDNNHPWEGITPFSHFEPGQYGKDCVAGLTSKDGNAATDKPALADTEWNQPSSWSWLYKSKDELKNPLDDPSNPGTNKPALITDDGSMKVGWLGGNSELKMDNDEAFFKEGMMVFSRGQTYYHRPGNWAEQPNFFNPFWKPRLASVWQGKKQLPFMNNVIKALPGPVVNMGQKIITH